jgi:hypothetical protein
MAKHLRAGKVFIDWSQNSDFKTTIGVYSLRAKNEMPLVSAPVTWDELQTVQKNGDVNILRLSPDATLARLERAGDLFAPLLKLKQILPKLGLEQQAREDETLKRGSPSRQTQARFNAAQGAPSSISKPELDALPRAPARFVEPMLLLSTAKLPEGSEWLYELLCGGPHNSSSVASEVMWRSGSNSNGRSR